jgi:nitroimidazol reductase NimA-like FMN-containing flavoprotein (pyridoxamine 5'-phosphate oxidase superfamily)
MTEGIRMNVQEITAAECYAKLASSGFGRLACARDNQPYVVPIYFAVKGEAIYAFSLAGQKVDWMRENPRVCLEADWMSGSNDWTSVVILGRYEELTDTPEFYNERLQALASLQTRPMWWEPGTSSLSSANERPEKGQAPVFFRILVDRVTGYRAAPQPPDGVAPHE